MSRSIQEIGYWLLNQASNDLGLKELVLMLQPLGCAEQQVAPAGKQGLAIRPEHGLGDARPYEGDDLVIAETCL